MSTIDPRVYDGDWVECPTCRGVGYIATQVAWEQAKLAQNAHAPRKGWLVCPTCAALRRILGPVCRRCGHLPSRCTCAVRCTVCQGTAPGFATWVEASLRFVARCRAHVGNGSVELVDSTQGALERATSDRRSRDAQRARTPRPKSPR